MEAFTSGLVSWRARRAWLEMRGACRGVSFDAERTARGYAYRMTGWESQIDMARAMGRGHASGSGVAHHWADQDRASLRA